MTGDGVPARFTWAVPESMASWLREELSQGGADLDPGDGSGAPSGLEDLEDAGFEPLLVFAGAASLSLLANTLSRIVRDHRQGGVVIDGRGEDLRIRQGVRGIDAGSVVVVGSDRSERFDSPDDAALRSILEKL